VAVRLTPKASRSQIGGVVETAAGGAALKVAVTAPPQDGKANAAMVKMLAKEWRVPKSSIAITAGAGDRNKTLIVTAAGNSEDLLRRLNQWMERHHD
jgi:uncharacterized protein (TIGR00251 family)